MSRCYICNYSSTGENTEEMHSHCNYLVYLPLEYIYICDNCEKISSENLSQLEDNGRYEV